MHDLNPVVGKLYRNYWDTTVTIKPSNKAFLLKHNQLCMLLSFTERTPNRFGIIFHEHLFLVEKQIISICMTIGEQDHRRDFSFFFREAKPWNLYQENYIKLKQHF